MSESLFSITQDKVDDGCWVVAVSKGGTNNVMKLSAPVTCTLTNDGPTIIRDRTEYFMNEIALATKDQNGLYVMLPSNPSFDDYFVFGDGIAYQVSLADDCKVSYSKTN